MTTTEALKKFERLKTVQDEIEAIGILYKDFKTLNASKTALRSELRTLREELRKEELQIMVEISAVEVTAERVA